MNERDAENALWWAVAAGAFLVWQAGVWLAARGRWQKAGERGVILPPPRFMGAMADNMASFLMDVLPVLIGLAQIATVFVAVLFVLFGVAGPLWVHHGPAAAIAGGVLVWSAGTLVSIAVLARLA